MGTLPFTKRFHIALYNNINKWSLNVHHLNLNVIIIVIFTYLGFRYKYMAYKGWLT